MTHTDRSLPPPSHYQHVIPRRHPHPAEGIGKGLSQHRRYVPTGQEGEPNIPVPGTTGRPPGYKSSLGRVLKHRASVSQDGRMMYHCFSLLLLTYLVWRRPLAGMVVGSLECMWLLWPLYGLPDVLSFDVHLTLALTCLFAWRADDARHSFGLAVAGGLVFGVLSHTPVDAWGPPSALLGGVLAGELIVAAWLTGRLLWHNHSGNADTRFASFIHQTVETCASLNAPLGKHESPPEFETSPAAPVPETT